MKLNDKGILVQDTGAAKEVPNSAFFNKRYTKKEKLKVKLKEEARGRQLDSMDAQRTQAESIKNNKD